MLGRVIFVVTLGVVAALLGSFSLLDRLSARAPVAAAGPAPAAAAADPPPTAGRRSATARGRRARGVRLSRGRAAS